MVSVEKYKNLDHTLKAMKSQIIDSVDFALNNSPVFENPKHLWMWLKPQLTFKSDGKYKGEKRELLQTMQTMMTGKVWGKKGLGDCDCFVITTIVLMIANNWGNIKIVLTGRNKLIPVHIYTVIYWNGKRQVLDFTNSQFNYERVYPYKQEIAVPWKKWLLTK
jgi:hypothetical protein